MALSRAFDSRYVVSMAVATLTSISVFALPVEKIVYDRAQSGQVTVILDPGYKSDLDLLIVLDDSGSMEAHQHNLMNNANSLVQQLKSSFASANVAITTTSVCKATSTYDRCLNGEFVGVNKVLKPGSPSFLNDFISNVQSVGTAGSAIESPFDATIAALSSPLLETGNAGFLRDGSHLAVVFVTDADDQSKASSAELIQFLENKKGAGHFSVSAFVSNSISCPADDTKTPAKIIEAVTLAQGKVYDICSPNYAAGLSDIGVHLGAQVDRTIQLPYQPVFSSITVQVGGIVLVAGDIYEGWTYDSKANMIILGENVMTQVKPGAKIEINFAIKQ